MKTIGMTLAVFVLVACLAGAQDAKTMYASMAPVEQYLIADRNAEIALARSAAPEAVGREAEVRVLGGRGYETSCERDERVRLPGRARVGYRLRRSGVLESEGADAALLQRSGCPLGAAGVPETDGVGAGGTDEGAGAGAHEGGGREEGFHGAGDSLDVLHVVEGRPSKR